MNGWPLTVRGTGAAVLAIACFFAAHAFKVTELLYISVLLVVILASSIATLYIFRRSDEVQRSFAPDVATAGSEVSVHLSIEMRSALPASQGSWSDELPDGVEGEASGVFPGTASGVWSAARATELDYTVLAARRGIRSIGPVSVRSTDPFGFARRRHTVGRPRPLTIAPAIVDLAPLAELPGEAGGSMHTATDQLGQGADNLVPRHYIPGDSMRRIHWRASAHRDQLMVRQEEQETTPEAVVVLDRAVARWDIAAVRAPGADPAFETAVSMCVSVAARLVHEGYDVSVLDVDGTPLAGTIDGGDIDALEQLAISFATLTAHREGSAASLVSLFAGTTTGPLVFITGVLNAADATLLAPLAHHSTLPVLFATSPAQDAFAPAAAAGWRTASIRGADDIADAWTSVSERGGNRVRVG